MSLRSTAVLIQRLRRLYRCTSLRLSGTRRTRTTVVNYNELLLITVLQQLATGLYVCIPRLWNSISLLYGPT